MKKMRKFLLAGFTALVVAFAPASVHAAPSPEASGIVQEIVSVTDKDGNPVGEATLENVDMESLDDATKEAVKNIKTQDGIKEALGSDYNDNMKTIDIKKVTLKSPTDQAVTFTFKVAGAKKGSVIYVVAYNEGKWVKVPCTVTEDGLAQVTFEAGFSSQILAFIADKTTLDTPATDGSDTGLETNGMLYGGIALVAIAGFAFAKKKSSK